MYLQKYKLLRLFEKVGGIFQSVKSKMAAIGHSEKQEFTYFIHWSPSGNFFLNALM